MNNAVLYLRYSSHSQNEKSIETQREVCMEYLKKNNLIFVGEYTDEAKTGTNDKRDGFQQMIEDSKKKTFDYIVTYKVDRFARDKYDSAIYKKDLKKLGIRVLSAVKNITDDPQGALMDGMLETLAHYYSLNLSKNIKDGMYTNAKKGLSTGGMSLPLGIKSVKEIREIIIDEEQALIVKKIFEMYRDKSAMADIIRYLNKYNIKTSRGNEFNKNSILRILKNKKYTCIYTFNVEEMPVRIP
ncbi:MAG: recombinase family protein [Bacilli bacterium]